MEAKSANNLLYMKKNIVQDFLLVIFSLLNTVSNIKRILKAFYYYLNLIYFKIE